MKRLTLGFLCCLMIQNVFADRAGNTLWDKLSNIQTMTATFSQHIYAKKREIAENSGTMAFVRPGRFRWETQQPMEQILIADGKKIWIYDVDLEQVTVKKQTESMEAAAALFLSDDKSRLLSDFYVEFKHEGKAEIFTLKAHAKQANIQRITLRFDAVCLASMDLYDQLGQHTAVRFYKAKINTPLSEKLFQFTPPVGVDVVEQ